MSRIVVKVEVRNGKNNLRESSNERHHYVNIIMISKKTRVWNVKKKEKEEERKERMDETLGLRKKILIFVKEAGWWMVAVYRNTWRFCYPITSGDLGRNIYIRIFYPFREIKYFWYYGYILNYFATSWKIYATICLRNTEFTFSK